MTKLKYCVLSLFAFALTTAFAQDSNILHTIADLEHRLQFEKFEVFRQHDARFEGDMAKTLIVRWSDQKVMRAKLKRAAYRGQATNNEPRYEIAAYRLQKLFLDPEEYVVPPTVLRSMPLEEYHKIEPYAVQLLTILRPCSSSSSTGWRTSIARKSTKKSALNRILCTRSIWET